MNWWDDLGKIDRAHLQAGQRFRKMLEDEIERANLGSLIETGEMSVVLDSEGMGPWASIASKRWRRIRQRFPRRG